MVSNLLRAAANGEDVDFPALDTDINWQYVEEVARTIIHALDAPPAKDTAFNTNGVVASFRGAATIVAELVPDIRISFKEDASDTAAMQTLREAPNTFDDGELRSQIGYTPQYTLRDGIERSLAAYASSANQTRSPA
jgi:nucleoside-diphosphate-sugar epimerase